MAALAVLTGCGGGDAGGGPSQVVARIGGVAITRATLEGHVGKSASKAARDAALSKLIVGQWIVALARSRGIANAGAGDPTAAASAVQALLLRSILREVPPVSERDIVADYTRTRQSFLVPERRVAEITNRKSKHEALQLRHEVEAGASLLTARQRRFHELSVTVSSPPGRRNAFEAMIFNAPPGTLTGPVKLWADYMLFRVIKVVPARYRTLREVRASLAEQHEASRRQLELEAFSKTWTPRLTAETICAPGYVVEDCSQYRGARAPNGGLSL